MNIFKTKLIISIIAFGLIISGCIGVGLSYFLPTFDWNWFVGLAIFYLIIESLVVSLVEKCSQKKDKKQLVNMYMLTKVIKVITSLIFVTVYVLTVKENIKAFVAVFILFYLLYLIAETFIFMKIEKRIKEKNSSNE
ncbi:hypothetical protein [Dysgonomonas sp. HGC4]|uniref:hypothetical protein n=1 Tax=Dysgonomonas sp. HGC4 TaxID=1658009 RepID=UPI00067FD97E|nr:hypothetical protein [Dysgonomonas sp. HGC4]MBD8347504.1 hypothetical protein [Dysgonomonas sp. HGC4]